MHLIALFQTVPEFFIGAVLVLGLLVGSFLNVVIFRLPKMMESEWRSECHHLLEIPPPEIEKFTLATPRSRCRGCQTPIRALDNIPIVSYLLLGGRCRKCAEPISIRYPLVEGLTGLLSGICAWQFGFDIACLFALILTWSLIALTFIDIDTQLLPDDITLPILWLGIVANIFGTFVDLYASVLGAIFGYLSLWSVYWVFKLITGKEGMGFGDFKLLALLGAWFGWYQLPQLIIVSSGVGAVFGIAMMAFAKIKRSQPIPFGPYLATAGFITLIWGKTISTLFYGGL